MPLLDVDGKWAVCMPKKSGSHSLIKLAGGEDLVFGDWHGCDLPEGFDGQRLMLIREPLERITSMYWDWPAPWNEPLFPIPIHGSVAPEEWFLRYLKGPFRSHWWSDLQSELAHEFRPDFAGDLHQIAAIIAPGAEVPHENATPGRESVSDTWAGISSHCQLALDEWCNRDEVSNA